MTIDGDGDRIIAMTGGHCPFWTEDHLCRLELELGPEAPCATCRKFPRLTQDYGVFTEYGLSLACPEAARRILTQPGPWILETQGEPGNPQEAEYDWESLLELASARKTLLELLWRQDLDSPGGTGPLPGYGQPVPGRLPWADAGALAGGRNFVPIPGQSYGRLLSPPPASQRPGNSDAPVAGPAGRGPGNAPHPLPLCRR